MISGRCERWWVASVKTFGAFRTEVNTRMDSFDTHLCNVEIRLEPGATGGG